MIEALPEASSGAKNGEWSAERLRGGPLSVPAKAPQGGTRMNAKRIGAILLIVAGALGLIYGTVGFGRETHQVSVGQMEMSVSEQRNVNIPVWAGVGAIVVGALLLLPLGNRRA